jgi:hypothetical protein
VPDAVRLRHLALARPLTRARGVRDRPSTTASSASAAAGH